MFGVTFGHVITVQVQKQIFVSSGDSASDLL